jgi:predicted nucleotidyltransferase component of viral defense system
MQKLIQLLTKIYNRPAVEKWNLCREYLQVIILRSLYASSAGPGLVFQGGTCLRICHDSKRYSEDLDFSKSPNTRRFSLAEAQRQVLRDLSRRGFAVEGNVHTSKTVQKSFVKISGLVEKFNLPFPKKQVLAVKLEVDARPPSGGKTETYFVSRLGELFLIQKYDLPTLFSGKMLALLFRSYARGRDYFDLVWFLQNHVPGNLKYFQSGIRQQAPRKQYRRWQDVLEAAKEKALGIPVKQLAEELRPFLEAPEDLRWIRQYPAVVTQLLQKY